MTLKRRTCFGIPVLLSPWVSACGGGDDQALTPAATLPKEPPARPVEPVLGKYRSTQPWLFVDTRASTPTQAGAGSYFETPARATVAAPAAAYNWGTVGPSYRCVEQYGDWAWTHPGGDWINAAGVAQGTSDAHFSFAANAVASGASVYQTDITAAVEAARAAGRWNAYIVKCGGARRAIASHHQPTLPAPQISVTYRDGTSATLRCVACVRLTGGTAYTMVGDPEPLIDAAVALEFERATKPVAGATLHLAITRHTSTPATVSGYLANPPQNIAVVQHGLALAYPGDVGLQADPAVLFAHRYDDGTTLADWVHPWSSLNVWETSNWSPHLFGLGAADATKLPYRYNGAPAPGKWFFKQPTASVSLVRSDYTGEGFAPLAAGLGALRVVTPGAPAPDGASFPPSGGLGADLWAVFDEPRCGTLDRVYTRFYMRIGSAPAPLASTKMFRQNAGTAYYATRGGKFGPGVHHWTYYGGNNNVGGGNIGWTNRGAWREIPADAPVGGVVPACHSWDMIGKNMPWGKDGGLGGALFPDQWYCVEVDCKLNAFSPTGGSPSDGVMTIYIDGRVAAVHTGWKYRDGPIDYNKTPPTRLAPFRSMGPIGLLLNDYNGGVLPADRDMVIFYTGIVASTSYVGPMSAAAVLPIRLSNNTWTPNRDAAGDVLLSDYAQLPLNQWVDVAGENNRLDSVIETPHAPRAAGQGGDGTPNIVAAWGGAAWDYVNQRMIIAGGGHADLIEYATGIYGITAGRLRFERLVDSQPPSALQAWNFSTHRLEPVSLGNSGNVPLRTGVPSFGHTFDGMVWLPPGTPGAGAVSGGLYITGMARTVVNLDNSVYQTTNWNNPETDIQDWSYSMSFFDGHTVYGPRAGWFHFKYDLTRTQATTWSVTSFGEMTVNYSKSRVLMPYSNKTWCWMRERREHVAFSAAAVRRTRYGAAIDAGGTDWSAYVDTVALTSNDGSHLDFTEKALADDGPLSSAGVHYDDAEACIWLQANNVGGPMYKITGIAGAQWTVQRVAGTAARFAPLRMTYGRFRVAMIGGIKLAMRVSATTDPIQVMRIG